MSNNGNSDSNSLSKIISSIKSSMMRLYEFLFNNKDSDAKRIANQTLKNSVLDDDFHLSFFFDGTGTNKFNITLRKSIYNEISGLDFDSENDPTLEQNEALANISYEEFYKIFVTKYNELQAKDEQKYDFINNAACTILPSDLELKKLAKFLYSVRLDSSVSNSYCNNDYSNIEILSDNLEAQDKKHYCNFYIEGIGTERFKIDKTIFGGGLAIGETGFEVRTEEVFENLGIWWQKNKSDILSRLKTRTSENSADIESTEPINEESLNNESEKIDLFTVNLFGFSRGSFLSRCFYYELKKLVSKYSTLESRLKILPREHEEYVGKYGDDVIDFARTIGGRVKFNVAVFFDTVSSHGLIQTNDVKTYHLDELYEGMQVLHIVAQDEFRKYFPITEITSCLSNTFALKNDAQTETCLNSEFQTDTASYGIEFSIPGVHSDIGGNYNKVEYEKLKSLGYILGDKTAAKDNALAKVPFYWYVNKGMYKLNKNGHFYNSLEDDLGIKSNTGYPFYELVNALSGKNNELLYSLENKFDHGEIFAFNGKACSVNRTIYNNYQHVVLDVVKNYLLTYTNLTFNSDFINSKYFIKLKDCKLNKDDNFSLKDAIKHHGFRNKIKKSLDAFLIKEQKQNETNTKNITCETLQDYANLMWKVLKRTADRYVPKSCIANNEILSKIDFGEELENIEITSPKINFDPLREGVSVAVMRDIYNRFVHNSLGESIANVCEIDANKGCDDVKQQYKCTYDNDFLAKKFNDDLKENPLTMEQAIYFPNFYPYVKLSTAELVTNIPLVSAKESYYEKLYRNFNKIFLGEFNIQLAAENTTRLSKSYFADYVNNFQEKIKLATKAGGMNATVEQCQGIGVVELIFSKKYTSFMQQENADTMIEKLNSNAYLKSCMESLKLDSRMSYPRVQRVQIIR